MMAMVKLDQHTTPQGNEDSDLAENYVVFGDPQFNHFVQWWQSQSHVIEALPALCQ